MRQIQEAMVVTPSSVVGAVLLSHQRRGVPGSRLYENSGFLLSLLLRRRARASASLRFTLEAHERTIQEADSQSVSAGARARGHAVQALLDQGITLLGRLVEINQAGGEPVYCVPDRNRIELDYYRNSVLAMLAPDCIIATALRASNDPMSDETLSAEARRLSYWFRLEFIYETETTFEVNYRETLDRLRAEGLVQTDEHGYVRPASPRALDFLRGMMLHLIEGYWVAADALRTLVSESMEKNEWLEFAREHAEREFLQGDVRRAEAASTAVLRNALALFIEEGLVVVERRKVRRPPTI